MLHAPYKEQIFLAGLAEPGSPWEALSWAALPNPPMNPLTRSLCEALAVSRMAAATRPGCSISSKHLLWPSACCSFPDTQEAESWASEWQPGRCCQRAQAGVRLAPSCWRLLGCQPHSWGHSSWRNRHYLLGPDSFWLTSGGFQGWWCHGEQGGSQGTMRGPAECAQRQIPLGFFFVQDWALSLCSLAFVSSCVLIGVYQPTLEGRKKRMKERRTQVRREGRMGRKEGGKEEERKGTPWFVVFDDFHGIKTPTAENCKAPTRSLWMWCWGDVQLHIIHSISTTDSCDTNNIKSILVDHSKRYETS